jgi:NAD(P)H dehydrogenase (quinone)
MATSIEWQKRLWKEQSEIIPDDVLEKYGAKAARASFAKIPVATVDQLADAHAIIFGTPTRFGNMAQMRNFLDHTGSLWAKGGLLGKVGSVFASTGTQHGGQETTITSFHTTLLHHGMLIVGVPYSESGLPHGRHHRRHSVWRHHTRRARRLPPSL